MIDVCTILLPWVAWYAERTTPPFLCAHLGTNARVHSCTWPIAQLAAVRQEIVGVERGQVLANPVDPSAVRVAVVGLLDRQATTVVRLLASRVAAKPMP